MSDEELMQQTANVPTMYFDGFGCFRRVNGVLRTIGFIIGTGAQLNMVVSLAGAEIANRETRRVLDEVPVKGIAIWRGASLPH